MKYKVIKDYPTANGILYKDELVNEAGNSTLKGHIRVKDNMGRIWFVPKQTIKKIKQHKKPIVWDFLCIYILCLSGQKFFDKLKMESRETNYLSMGLTEQ